MPARSYYRLYKIICGYLLFIAAVTALLDDSTECLLTADSGECDTAAPDVPTLCLATIAATLARLYEQLPASQPMFAELYATPNFKIVCDDAENFVARHNKHEITAYYNMNENMIYLPVANEAVRKEGLESQLHHEAIHATTVNRHKSPYCNLNLFSAKELKKLAVSNRAGTNAPLPFSPIWPPTLSNLQLLDGVIRSDLNLPWHEQLIKFNNKIFNYDKFSEIELLELNNSKDLLKGILIPPGRINLGDPVTKKKPTSVTNRMLSATVIFTNLAWIDLPNGKFQLVGKITDIISALLYRVQLAQMEYQNYVKQNHYVLAIAEFDAHLRTGLTEQQLKTFFPGLTAQIDRDRDCCLHGNVTRCIR